MLARDAQTALQVLKMLTTRPGSGCRMTGQNVSTRGADQDTFTVRARRRWLGSNPQSAKAMCCGSGSKMRAGER